MLDDCAEHIRKGRPHVINVDGAPAARGTGLGRQLIRFADHSAVTAGFDTIRLYIHVTMTETIELYLRNGFVETHRQVQKGPSRVFMSKRLG